MDTLDNDEEPHSNQQLHTPPKWVVTCLAIGAGSSLLFTIFTENYFDAPPRWGILAFLTLTTIILIIWRCAISERFIETVPPEFKGVQASIIANGDHPWQRTPFDNWNAGPRSQDPARIGYGARCEQEYKHKFPHHITLINSIKRLIAGAARVPRAHERFTLLEDHMVVRKEIEIQLDRNTSNVVTVMPVPKGVLLDSLELTVDGAPRPALGFYEVQGFTRLAIESLLFRLFKRTAASEGLLDQLHALISPTTPDRVAQNDQLAIVMLQLYKLKEQEDLGIPPQRAGAELTQSPSPRHETEEVFEQYLKLIRLLAFNYLLMVEVKEPENKADPLDSCIITCSYKSRIELPKVARSLQRSKLRGFLGMTPRWIEFELHGISRSRSLHVTVDGPEGMYVHYARIISSVEPPPAANDSSWPRAEVSNTLGLGHIHAYLREFPGIEEPGAGPKVSLSAEFRDVPPGPTSSVLLGSIALMVLVGVIVLNFTSLTKVGWTSLAIILASPAVIAGWIVSRTSDAMVRKMSFPSIVTTIWLVVNCGATILVGAIPSTRSADFSAFIGWLSPVLPLLAGRVGQVSWWLIILLSATTNLSVTLFIWLSRGIRYSFRLAGRAQEHQTISKQ